VILEVSPLTDTYDRRVQLGASRRRLEDAQALHQQKRWSGAMYLAGYAIECSLKSLICYEERKNNFKDTQIFKNGLKAAELHNLARLLDCVPSIRSAIQRANKTDRTNGYLAAWNMVSSVWRNDELRYSDQSGNERESQRFIESVQKLHRLLLDKQGETS
jgi:hypothetical protein